jgi:hypothetical protein
MKNLIAKRLYLGTDMEISSVTQAMLAGEVMAFNQRPKASRRRETCRKTFMQKNSPIPEGTGLGSSIWLGLTAEH